MMEHQHGPPGAPPSEPHVATRAEPLEASSAAPHAEHPCDEQALVAAAATQQPAALLPLAPYTPSTLVAGATLTALQRCIDQMITRVEGKTERSRAASWHEANSSRAVVASLHPGQC